MSNRGTIPRLRGFDYRSSRTYFVTWCVWKRKPIFNDFKMADVARRAILEYRSRDWYWLLAYCVMPDHIHMLVRLRTDDRSLSRVVASLKNRINTRLREVGVSVDWQMGFHDTLLRSSEDPRLVARYVVENPVRAGLVSKYGDYEFGGIVDDWR
jgi:putative transposase